MTKFTKEQQPSHPKQHGIRNYFHRVSHKRVAPTLPRRGNQSRPLLLELFCGTHSVGKVAESMGWEVVSLDWREETNATLTQDIMTFSSEDFVRKYGKPDVIWASPDCTQYSRILNTMPHIKRDLKTSNAMVRKVLSVIDELKPAFHFIENPATGLLKNQTFMKQIPRREVSYCRYGFGCKKSTLIFGTIQRLRLRRCITADGLCEEKQKYGRHLQIIGDNSVKQMSKTDRLRIPSALIEHILGSCRMYVPQSPNHHVSS